MASLINLVSKGIIYNSENIANFDPWCYSDTDEIKEREKDALLYLYTCIEFVINHKGNEEYNSYNRDDIFDNKLFWEVVRQVYFLEQGERIVIDETPEKGSQEVRFVFHLPNNCYAAIDGNWTEWEGFIPHGDAWSFFKVKPREKVVIEYVKDDDDDL